MEKNYFTIIMAFFVLCTFSCGSFSSELRNEKEHKIEEQIEIVTKNEEFHFCNEKRFEIKDTISDVIGYSRLIKCLLTYGSENEISEIIKKCDYRLIRYLAGSEFFLENLRGEIVFLGFLNKGVNYDCVQSIDGDCQGSTQTVFNTRILARMINNIEGYNSNDFIVKKYKLLEYNERLRMSNEYDFPTMDLFGFSVIKQAWEEGKIVLLSN